MTEPRAPGCPMSGATDSLTLRPERLTDSWSLTPRGALMQAQRYEDGRALLKDPALAQAGFLAKVAGNVQGAAHPPVLYMQGEEHVEMRRATARYFTPAAVNGYGPMIARLADDLIAELLRKGEMNVDDLSLRLAVQVASNVVGLTSSRLPGLERRIEAFVSGGLDSAPDAHNRLSPLRDTLMGGAVSLFFMLDVKPAIEARRRERQDDLISYLLDRDYSDQDILTECITYATAGMITTREFITLAAYQMLQRPDLRAEYVHSTEPARHAILHELLRLDPVVAMLYRRAEQDTVVNGQPLAAGTTFAINVQAANADPDVMGADAGSLCPHRTLPRGVPPQGLAFGDGPHRCPGAFLAIKESDMFLRRLLLWNDLTLVRHPSVGYNEIVKGYELRGLRVRLGMQTAQA